MKRTWSTLVFVILLAGISLFYDYQDITFKRPQSVHKWRQSDCASIALNYYQDGMKFFQPETHNLTSDGGTTGQCFTSEIPLLYYAVAALYKVFGYHDYIYRIFNTLVFFLGLFYLFRLLRYVVKDEFWAISLSLLFFTSPLLVFYGNNFLSNSAVLAFSVTGWYYFTRFASERRSGWFLISVFFFFLAAALKVTALLNLFVIAGLLFMEVTGMARFSEKGKLFERPVKLLVPVTAVFIILGAWIVYAHNFNKLHDCTYFSTNIFPLWDLSPAQITRVINNVKRIWLIEYFNLSVLVFLAACSGFIAIYFKKSNRMLLYSALLLLLGCIAYVILQFMQFADHDYYVIDMYILPVVIVVTAFDLLRRNFNKVFSSVFVKLGFTLFLAYNIYYANQRVRERYNGWMNDYPENADIYSITPYLRELGISPEDTVISIPDYCHLTLYLMNQKGWTEYSDSRLGQGEKIRYNQDSAGIRSSIDKGARYLILNGRNELYTKPYLQSFCTDLIGTYGNVLIFDLKGKEENFSLTKREIMGRYATGAEELTGDLQYFKSEADSAVFHGGMNRSADFAHGGKFSCRVNSESPYGFTLRLGGLKSGESFLITVWRKGTVKEKSSLVASSSPNPFYYNDYSIPVKEADGWEKLQLEFFIRPELENQELVIYVYNPEPGPVYFDDLEITRYR